MLKLPSVIIEQAGATTRRQYASIIFKCLQQPSGTTESLKACFEKEKDAALFTQHVQDRVNITFPCDIAEECFILPPLFLRSNESFIGESTQILLVAYDTGLIFPVVRLRNTDQLIGDKSLLTSLYCLYEASTSERATQHTINQILLAAQ